MPAKHPDSVLFIGGVADGRRIPDPGKRYWGMQAEYRVFPFGHPTSAPTEIRREQSIYRRERFYAEREEFVIYVCDRLTLSQATVKLIRGYPPADHPVHPPRTKPMNQEPNSPASDDATCSQCAEWRQLADGTLNTLRITRAKYGIGNRHVMMEKNREIEKLREVLQFVATDKIANATDMRCRAARALEFCPANVDVDASADEKTQTKTTDV